MKRSDDLVQSISATFRHIKEISKIVWKFHRYIRVSTHYSGGVSCISSIIGTVGRRTRLVTNCFHIGLHGKQIHYYEVLIRIKQKDGSILAPKTLRLKRGIFWSFMIANATEKFGIELYQVRMFLTQTTSLYPGCIRR